MGRPAYIALEGTEGCGKSTQARLLATERGATLTRETGGTPVGERLREILHDVEVTDLDSRAEALMIAADRAQHIARVVLPALDSGRDVVSDRSVYSTLAYQGYGRRIELAELRRINHWAVRGCWPDVVVLLDVTDDVVVERLAGRRLDRFEQETASFHERVRDGFRTMAADDDRHWLVVEASGSVDDVADAVRAGLTKHLDR
ncbi:MAG: dTMP kinase [Acidimicrobiia bacterium]|jgi:dTMP kinase|nr:dTMP kinase [Acidimicrobiia bacterium]MDQ3392306.1 dTMP kinase [Actinomycetota bacterium]